MSGDIHGTRKELIAFIVKQRADNERLTAELRDIKDRVDVRLNDYLCGMKPGYDDSITGFNEAWDIVRKTFEAALKETTP